MDHRHRLKWALTRRLYERGCAKREVLELFRLIDWLLVLPEDLAVAFHRELREYERQMSSPVRVRSRPRDIRQSPGCSRDACGHKHLPTGAATQTEDGGRLMVIQSAKELEVYKVASDLSIFEIITRIHSIEHS